jgi:hypothetical protein
MTQRQPVAEPQTLVQGPEQPGRSEANGAEYARPSTRRQFWALFALKYALGIESIPKDPREAALDPAPKTGKEKLIRRLESRVLQKILDETHTAHPAYVPEVPRIRPSDLTPKDFIKRFYYCNQPVIIDGLIKDSEAVRNWTLPWFKHNYGSAALKVVKDRNTNVSGFNVPTAYLTMAEAIVSMLADQPTYINNYSGIFTEHPKLLDQVDLYKIRRYTPSLVKDPSGLNLFIGGKRSGSSLHCAAGGNFFCMIHGEKKWTLAHPSFTPYMYATLHSTGLYAASAINGLKSFDQLDQEGYRLWRHVPKYVAYLKQGDVYFNPQWWWHMVENPTDTSIGLAVRVLHKKPFVGNPVFQALALCRPQLLKVSARWMFTRQPMRDKDLLEHIFKSTGQNPH